MTPQSWASLFDDAAASCIPQTTPVAFMDFPFHLNPGDSAITIGEYAWLARNGSRVVFSARRESLEHGLWPTLDQSVTIVFQGGGNMGDLYPEHPRLFGEMLRRFPNNPVVQMPQSLNFSTDSAARPIADAIRAHGGVSMLWRDVPSFERARSLFPGAAENMLTPDAAAGFRGWQRTMAPQRDVVTLFREDLESGTGGEQVGLNGDWPYSRTDKLVWKAASLRHELLDRLAVGGSRHRSQLYRWLVGMNIENGLNALSRGRIVVTDRLHGHILCSLMGVPHVAVNDAFGKIANYYSTWSQDIESAVFAASRAEIPGALARLSEVVDAR